MKRAWILSVFLLVAGIGATEKQPVVSLKRVPNGGIQPQVAADAKGSIHMLYFTGDPAGGDLMYVRSGDGGSSFTAPIRVNSQQGSAIATGTMRGGQIAIGKNGRVHVAWPGSSAARPLGPPNLEAPQYTTAPMLYARLNEDGTAFEPQRNLELSSFGRDGGTVAADDAGNVYVAWHAKGKGAAKGEAGRQVWVAESHDNGKTFAEEVPGANEPTGACGCCGLAMFANRSGTLYTLYRAAKEDIHRDIYLTVSEDRGKSFRGSMVHPWEINACPMSSMAFAEGAGSTTAAWETDGQVFFGKIRGTAIPKVTGAPGEAKGRKHPRVAVNARGEMLLVWTEGTGWQKGGSFTWQAFDRDGNAIGEKAMSPGIATWSFAAVAARPDGSFTLFY